MLAQSDALNEIEVGVDDFLRRMAAYHPEQQGDDALDDERVAVSGEPKRAISVVALQPYTALATIYEILLVLVLLVLGLKVVSKVNKHLVFVHPVVQIGELINNLVLYLVDGTSARRLMA